MKDSKMERDFYNMERLIVRLKFPEVNGVVLSKFNLDPNSELLNKYIKGKDLDIVGGTIYKISKEEIIKNKKGKLTQRLIDVNTAITRLGYERENIKKQILEMHGGATNGKEKQ
ncbi:MAG: hypothetical protein ACTSPI_17370 [Candidatus Heimdallarchaeaceae archaeon]